MNYPPPSHNLLQQNPIMINLTNSDEPEYISKQVSFNCLRRPIFMNIFYADRLYDIRQAFRSDSLYIWMWKEIGCQLCDNMYGCQSFPQVFPSHLHRWLWPLPDSRYLLVPGREGGGQSPQAQRRYQHRVFSLAQKPRAPASWWSVLEHKRRHCSGRIISTQNVSVWSEVPPPSQVFVALSEVSEGLDVWRCLVKISYS